MLRRRMMTFFFRIIVTQVQSMRFVQYRGNTALALFAFIDLQRKDDVINSHVDMIAWSRFRADSRSAARCATPHDRGK